MTHPVQKTDLQWQSILVDKDAEPVAFAVTRQGATERPFTGRYESEWRSGRYLCMCCDAWLFDASTKFDAGCGWPSFSDQTDAHMVQERVDHSHGMVRTEVVCVQCGAHLGHVFPDGPAPTGLRYCINSASLNFEPAQAQSLTQREETKTENETKT